MVNERAAAYQANSLNQYSSREVPPFVDVLGSAAGAGDTYITVTGPGGQTVGVQQDTAFHAAVPVANVTAQYPTLTVKAIKGGGSAGTDYTQNISGRFFWRKARSCLATTTRGICWRMGAGLMAGMQRAGWPAWKPPARR